MTQGKVLRINEDVINIRNIEGFTYEMRHGQQETFKPLKSLVTIIKENIRKSSAALRTQVVACK